MPVAARDRVLLVATHFAPGGTTIAINLISSQLIMRGYHVSTVALYDRSGLGTGEWNSGSSRALVETAHPNLFDYGKALRELQKIICELKPGAVLGTMPAANIIAGACAYAAGVPLRVASHHVTRGGQNPLMRLLDNVATRAGIFTDIVCVSQAVAKTLSGAHHRIADVHVIPNGIPRFTAQRSRFEICQKHGLCAQQPFLCMVGRLVPEKNILGTIMAACRAPHVRLAVAGDGPLKQAAENIIAAEAAQDRIHLLGALSHRDSLELIHSADGFVQLSHYEGRSLALLEALMAKSPILSSDIAAQREVLALPDGGIAGLLCAPDDIERISYAMSRLVSEPSLRRELSARAALLGPSLNVDHMGDGYSALFRM